jgi:hypothetical protein
VRQKASSTRRQAEEQRRRPMSAAAAGHSGSSQQHGSQQLQRPFSASPLRRAGSRSSSGPVGRHRTLTERSKPRSLHSLLPAPRFPGSSRSHSPGRLPGHSLSAGSEWTPSGAMYAPAGAAYGQWGGCSTGEDGYAAEVEEGEEGEAEEVYGGAASDGQGRQDVLLAARQVEQQAWEAISASTALSARQRALLGSPGKAKSAAGAAEAR